MRKYVFEVILDINGVVYPKDVVTYKGRNKVN